MIPLPPSSKLQRVSEASGIEQAIVPLSAPGSESAKVPLPRAENSSRVGSAAREGEEGNPSRVGSAAREGEEGNLSRGGPAAREGEEGNPSRVGSAAREGEEVNPSRVPIPGPEGQSAISSQSQQRRQRLTVLKKKAERAKAEEELEQRN